MHACYVACLGALHPIFLRVFRDADYGRRQWSLSQGEWSASYEPVNSLQHVLTFCIATEIEGTFRVSGSTKRMRDLQALFENPPRVRDLLRLTSIISHSSVASVWQKP